MEAPIGYEIAAIALLILLNGFFAGAEIAVVAVRPSRLAGPLERGDRRARAVLALRRSPERFLATVQIGVTVVGATAAAFSGAVIADRLTPLIAAVSWLEPEADEIALAVVIALVSFLTIVLGELVPKSLALRSSERFAFLAARPVALLASLARPLVWFLTASSNLFLRPFGDRTTFTEARHSPDELRQMLEEAAQAGTLDARAGDIAVRALDLPDLLVSDVMIPRVDVMMLRRDTPSEELRRLLSEPTHTRLPVYEMSHENVVGYVHIKDLLARISRGELPSLDAIVRPALYVPEAKRAVALLAEMRRERKPFAIVIDDAGGLAGIVTMDDVLDEIVGHIATEHEPRSAEEMRRDADGTVVVAGSATVRDVNRSMGLDLPEGGDWTTVAGLCTSLAGRIPTQGDRIDAGSVGTLEVLEASDRRVVRVRIVPPDSPRD